VLPATFADDLTGSREYTAPSARNPSVLDLDREHDCRAASRVSVVPLVAVVVATFLPAVQACHRVTTPAAEIARGAIWGAPPFVLAGVLALGTLVALFQKRRRRPRAWLGPYRQHVLAQEPPPAPGFLLAWSMALSSMTGVAVTVLSMAQLDRSTLLGALLLGGPYVAVTLWLFRRLDGWTRWTALQLLWAVQATCPVGLCLSTGVFDPATPGATLYMLGIGLVAMAGLTAFARTGARLRRRSGLALRARSG